jgi:hypothetical protein
VFVNHLSGAKGQQNGKADEAQESFGEFVKAGGDSPVTLDSLEEVFHSMTATVELCGEWYSRSAVSATRNAGFNSLAGRCLSEGGAIIGFVANKGRILWQTLRELFCQRDVRFVPTGQGNDNSLRTGVDDSMNLRV